MERLKRLGTQECVGQTLVDAGDWITKGAMTPVKNQRQCRSYWAFSITDSLEDARLIAPGNTSHLCEQQLADCDTVGSTYQDGLMDKGFDSVEKNAMCTEAIYSHSATKGTCRASSCNVGSPRDVSRDTRACPVSAL